MSAICRVLFVDLLKKYSCTFTICGKLSLLSEWVALWALVIKYPESYPFRGWQLHPILTTRKETNMSSRDEMHAETIFALLVAAMIFHIAEALVCGLILAEVLAEVLDYLLPPATEYASPVFMTEISLFVDLPIRLYNIERSKDDRSLMKTIFYSILDVVFLLALFLLFGFG